LAIFAKKSGYASRALHFDTIEIEGLGLQPDTGAQESDMKKLTAFGIIAGAMLVSATPLSLNWSASKSMALSVDGAQARIGRPLTPFSVAGVNRRAYRRAAYAGAAGLAAGAYYGAYGYPGYAGYSDDSYNYASTGYSYPGYGYGYGYSYSNGYPSYSSGYGTSYSNYGYYPSYGYRGYSYPNYGYSYPASYGSYYRSGLYGGYRVARRVAIHRARWH
jgi:hypothetical protein